MSLLLDTATRPNWTLKKVPVDAPLLTSGCRFFFDQPCNFAGLCMASEFRFLENRSAVDKDFETTAARGNQFDARIRIFLVELSRQTGGSGLVVSKSAVFDGDVHVDVPARNR